MCEYDLNLDFKLTEYPIIKHRNGGQCACAETLKVYDTIESKVIGKSISRNH